MLIPRADHGKTINIARRGSAGRRVPRAVCSCASPRTRRLSLSGNAGSTEREEGGRSERTAGRRRTARKLPVRMCEARGVRGPCSRPPGPSFPLFSLPPPPAPRNARPAPPRPRTQPPAPGARSRLAPRAREAPSLGSGTRSRVGRGGRLLDPPRWLIRKLRDEWTLRDCTRGGGGNQGLGGKPWLWPVSPASSPGRELGAGCGVLGRNRFRLPRGFQDPLGEGTPSLEIMAERDN